MLKKTVCLVVTFRETVDAMAAEKFCQEQHLPGRLIPVPREITAGCGLAWRAAVQDQELLCASFERGSVRWDRAYILEI